MSMLNPITRRLWNLRRILTPPLASALMKEMKQHRVGDVWSVAPFDGRSLKASKQVIMKFQTTRWHLHQNGHRAQSRTLVKLLQLEINKVWTSPCGFELEDYVYENSTDVRDRYPLRHHEQPCT